MSGRPVEHIRAKMNERGWDGTDADLEKRFADLRPSDLLAVLFNEASAAVSAAEAVDELVRRVDRIAVLLANRAEPDAHRRAMALYDPEFTFDDPQPVI